jgi:hypothetical protein
MARDRIPSRAVTTVRVRAHGIQIAISLEEAQLVPQRHNGQRPVNAPPGGKRAEGYSTELMQAAGCGAGPRNEATVKGAQTVNWILRATLVTGYATTRE